MPAHDFPTIIAPGLYTMRVAGRGPVYAETATGCIIAALTLEASERFRGMSRLQSDQHKGCPHVPDQALP